MIYHIGIGASGFNTGNSVLEFILNRIFDPKNSLLLDFKIFLFEAYDFAYDS